MADTISTKRITDLPEDTDVNDNDLFMAGSNGTASLRKKKWSTILNKIKSVLLANNLTTTTAGYALDARQGKVLKDQLDQQNTKIQNFSLYSAHITDSIYLDNKLYNSGTFYDLVGIMLDATAVGQPGRYFIIAKLIATDDAQASTTYVSSGKLLKYVHIGEGNEYGWDSF